MNVFARLVNTLDEVFETLTLIQAAKISRSPLVVLGSECWKNLLDFLKDFILVEHSIDTEDLKSVYVTDAAEYIGAYHDIV